MVQSQIKNDKEKDEFNRKRGGQNELEKEEIKSYNVVGKEEYETMMDDRFVTRFGY